jgi:hypothetical protein
VQEAGGWIQPNGFQGEVAMFFDRDFFFVRLKMRQGVPQRAKETALREGKLLRRNTKPTDDRAAAAMTAPIATTGEVFADGTTIDLIGGVQSGNPRLMVWNGSKEIVGSLVEHDGRLYEPAPINSGVLQELSLPTRCRSHGNTREFLTETCKLLANFVGLEEKPTALVGRIVLCGSLIDAVSVAPALMIVGPDTPRANRLVALLRCLCRHALRLTGVTPAGLCSLPSGARFTYLISQTSMSDKLRLLLDHASNRDRRIPSRGRLLDLFGVQVIHSDSVLAGESWPRRSIQISMIPTGRELPHLDLDTQRQIMSDFQPRLLSFRRANLRTAHKMRFDASQFSFVLQDLAHSFAAATPDDTKLQSELFDLLQEKGTEIQSETWLELNCVLLEAIVVAGSESPGGVVYIADLAEIAQEILRRRGERTVEIDPGVFGKRLKVLGFSTEPRDARGKKLRLTDAVLNRARLLTREFGGLEVGDDGPVNSTQQRKEI